MSEFVNQFDTVWYKTEAENSIELHRNTFSEINAQNQKKININEVETGILVLSQLSFTIFGSLFNLFLFITLRDLPNLSASTYHVLLVNLSFCNLLICTFIKPVTSIYISYAFANVSSLNVFRTFTSIIFSE